MARIKSKNPCKGVKFDSDLNKKYGVTWLPFQNLHGAHPLRVAWEKANPTKKWSEDGGRDGVEMRVACKKLGREESLSYMKLVRSTAVRLNKDGKLTGASRKDIYKILELDQTRLFQNLINVVDMDKMFFMDSINAVQEIVDMFVDDVMLEIPHAKSGGGKTKAEIEAELIAKQVEQQMALRDDARSYVKRAGTVQGVAGVPFNSDVTFDMLRDAFNEYLEKLDAKKDKDVIERLEAWAMPFKAVWGD